MDSFYLNEELECHYCGYRFFIAGDRVMQFPTFCPECGETEVYRAKWDYSGEEGANALLDEMEYDGPGVGNLIQFD